ncbi:Transcriptional regulator, contains XRE-family HTH domain [Flexibacter flexilis DSM 6793]|uniref:Transcriptional regulator, contains XRE-family HTH domain n=2 Tax=Flexibacter flexilis TaxID=998 RepID=A0A1I1DUW1_9BACT|nr:Transcriptional regulator, contains XRE-family HTH domain [Flexibacter flexilis DSM 6793]
MCNWSLCVMFVIVILNKSNLQTPMQLGRKLRALRASRNFTQEYVASQIGISQAAYSALENDRTVLSVKQLVQITQVLNVSLAEILPPSLLPHSDTESLEKNMEELKSNYEKMLADREAEIAHLSELLSRFSNRDTD